MSIVQIRIDGVQGSGKSTISNIIRKALKEAKIEHEMPNAKKFRELDTFIVCKVKQSQKGNRHD